MPRMDPIEAINALRKNGWSEPRIAREAGCNQSSINRYRREKRMPDWHLGVRLIALAQIHGKQPTGRRGR